MPVELSELSRDGVGQMLMDIYRSEAQEWNERIKRGEVAASSYPYFNGLQILTHPRTYADIMRIKGFCYDFGMPSGVRLLDFDLYINTDHKMPMGILMVNNGRKSSQEGYFEYAVKVNVPQHAPL